MIPKHFKKTDRILYQLCDSITLSTKVHLSGFNALTRKNPTLYCGVVRDIRRRELNIAGTVARQLRTLKCCYCHDI